MVNLSLLGPFQADLDGQPVHSFKAQKAKALLIYLAVESHHSHQRESLMTMLWPGFALQSAQQNLRQTLYLLRQSLPIKDDTPDLFLVDRTTVSWNPEVSLSLDIAQFENLSASLEITDRRRAADLYRGHFLEDFYLPDSEPFEEWVTSKRAYYFNAVQDLIGHLADDYIAAANWHAAEEVTRRLLAFDKLQEPAHRQLIEVLARSGRRQDAIRQYNTLRQLLKDELDLDPDPETISLVGAIRDGSLSQSPPVPHSPHAPIPRPESPAIDQPRHNLPHSLANFIGRQQEIAEIESLLCDHRLVMLTGAAGIGKTNLCLKVGHQLLDSFPDGVWMVELAPVTDPTFIPQAVASALGLSESSGRPIEEILLDVLRDNQSLLILDNCEHLIEDAARLAETILRNAPAAKILASSLEPFEISGEIQYPVPPLSNPAGSVIVLPEEWQHYDALRLFVERAQSVDPGFQVTEKNIASVLQICQRLDGIPLAIELAAARVNVLSVADIAARLDDRFNLLVGGNRTAMPRHQTLRGMMEWSWDLLSQPEKDLLQRLSVFSGGMTLQAVEGVCCGDGVDPTNLLELLTQLVNKSFVVTKRQPGQQVRYHLLETIRQYGIEQLEKAGKLDDFRDRHLATFVQLAEEAEPNLISFEQGIWIQQLRRELDNLRAALLWARQTDIEAGLKLMTALHQFWAYGYMVEGERWIRTLLTQAGPAVDKTLLAKAYWTQSRFNMWPLLDMNETRRLAELGHAIYEELEDQCGMAYCNASIGWSHYYTDPKKYERMIGQSLQIFRAIGEKLGLAETLFWLTQFQEQRGYEEAKTNYAESLTYFREIGHLVGIINVLENSARLATFHGDYEPARAMLEECLEIHESLGHQGSAHTLELLGHLYLSMGEYDSAHRYMEESFVLSKNNGETSQHTWASIRMGYVLLRMGELEKAGEMMINTIQPFMDAEILIGVTYVLEGLASLNVILNQAEKAAQLLGWADKTRKEVLDIRPPVEEKDVQKDKSAIIEMIGEEAYNAAYAAGQSLSTELAITLAKNGS